MDRKTATEQPVRSMPLLVVLFILGTFVGLIGTFVALVGTQAATGHEPFLSTFLSMAAFYIIVWSIAGLIVSLGFRDRGLKWMVLWSFAVGGLCASIPETLFICTPLLDGDFALLLCLITAPVIGLFGVKRAVKKVRKNNL